MIPAFPNTKNTTRTDVLPASDCPISETIYRCIMHENAEQFAQFDENSNDGIVMDEAFSTAWLFTSMQDHDYSLR